MSATANTFARDPIGVPGSGDIDAYDFVLPPELVAQEPLRDRSASRLLRIERDTGRVAHHVFDQLPSLLAPGDLLVVNRSRVFPARLLGTRSGGGQAEILLVRQVDGPRWEALLRPGRRLRSGDRIRIAPDFEAVIEPGPDTLDARRPIRLLVTPPDSVDAALARHGHVPLPPYVRRPDTPVDRERYQCVYARERGSIAAPTAGLHFTDALLRTLEAAGVEIAEIVLHVGPGTFRPVKTALVADHRVDPEPYEIPAAAATAISTTRARRGRVIAVGTTTTRALETAARGDGSVAPGPGTTDLVIVPGMRFRVVDGLITNFHLPRSSLLLLTAAFAGRQALFSAYDEAVRARYRFYSYGDATLIL